MNILVNNVETKSMSIFLPIDTVKAVDTETEKKTVYVQGWASNDTLDLQNEIVNPTGIDISYFKEHGWINYEHQQDAEYVIGVPTENCSVDVNKGLFVEAKLFDENPYAQTIINLADTLTKTGVERKLGFSIEGVIKQRNENDSRIIEEVMITNVAITKSPANPTATWDVFRKSLTSKAFETGHGTSPETQVDGGAVRRESLAQSITRLSDVYSLDNAQAIKDTWKSVVDCLETENKLDYNTAVLTLQVVKGLSRVEAERAVLNMREEQLRNG